MPKYQDLYYLDIAIRCSGAKFFAAVQQWRKVHASNNLPHNLPQYVHHSLVGFFLLPGRGFVQDI